jgi:hypothetical protein
MRMLRRLGDTDWATYFTVPPNDLPHRRWAATCTRAVSVWGSQNVMFID